MLLRLCAPLMIGGLLFACSAQHESPPAPARASQTSPGAKAAEDFVEALNRGDVGALVALSTLPFHFRTQEWESAGDGFGFVLGAATEREIADRAALAKFFEDLAKRVEIEQHEASEVLPPGNALLAEEMRAAHRAWSGYWLCVFLRGSGDVEHIAVVGLASDSGKVAGLYLN